VEEGIQGDFDLEGAFSQYQIAYKAQAVEGTLEVVIWYWLRSKCEKCC